MRRLVVLVISCAGTTTLAQGQQQTVLEPGLWRVVAKSTTNGRPEPDQDEEVCLSAELKDLGKYFAPELEGVRAKCGRTKRPTGNPNVLAYRMTCTGIDAKFTTEMQTNVTIVSATHFKLSMKIDTKTPTETALVVAEGEAKRVGPCPKS
jgi:hypothetical protein